MNLRDASGALRVIFFMVMLAGSTVMLHEMGHYITGEAVGCDGKEITLFDGSWGAHTSMNCPPDIRYGLQLIFLGGFLLVIPFSYLIWHMKWLQYYSPIILGFNMTISSSDIASLSGSLVVPSILAGIILILWGQNTIIGKQMNIQIGAVAANQGGRKKAGF